MKKITALLFLIIAVTFSLRAQELNCTVKIIHKQVQGVNPAIFTQMEEDIFAFMNNRKWTNDVFAIEERIKCSMILTIEEARASSNTYSASLQIISSRPVYNTDYSSPVLNIKDEDVDFDYFQNTQYTFNPNQFSNNLISVLAYYAYMVIGTDYDTFSPEGGTPYYQIAQTIVQSAQNSSASGWKAYEGDKNRYWLVENILHRTFQPLRNIYYNYHRKGMDVMSEKLQMGRSVILAQLKTLESIHNIKPMAYNTQVFFLAKSDEIVNIFSQAPVQERNELYEVLAKVDPGNLSKYEKMKKGK